MIARRVVPVSSGGILGEGIEIPFEMNYYGLMFDIGEPPEAPHWMRPLTDALGPDGDTGWVDVDAALEAMAWLGKLIFAQSTEDRGGQSRAGLLAQVEAAAAVTNTLSAFQAVRMAQFAATEHAGSVGAHRSVTPDDTEHDTRWERPLPLGDKVDFADTEIGAALCWGPMQATNRVEDAIDAVTKTPRLLREMGAGRIDAYRVSQVTRELVEAGSYTCERVEDELLVRGVTGWTSRRVAAQARSWVRRVDPAASRTIRTKRARDAINVFTRPGDLDGTTEMTAILRSGDALSAFQAIESLATAMHADTESDTTLGECRAAAMVDLILNNAHVETNVTVLVPVKTGQSDDATGDVHRAAADAGGDEDRAAGAESAGSSVEAALGWVLADVDWDHELESLVQWFPAPEPSVFVDLQGTGVASSTPAATPPMSGSTRPTWASAPPHAAPRDGDACAAVGSTGLTDVEVPRIGVIPAETVAEMIRSVGTRITRAMIDADTGAMRETSTTAYRPTAAIRRFVVRRDRHCRFPGCERDARYCDADHVLPWPRGRTTPANLQLLCRFHHRAKHEGRWSVTMSPDGVCLWVSATGRRYVTHPGSADVTGELTVTSGMAPLRDPPADLVDDGG